MLNRFNLEKAQHAISLFPKRMFDFGELSRMARSRNIEEEVIAKQLLLDNFKSRLSPKEIMDFAYSSNPTISDRARKIALKRFPKKLDFKSLLHFQKTDDEGVYAAAFTLTMKLPKDAISEELLKECWLHTTWTHARTCALFLLQKHFAGTIYL